MTFSDEEQIKNVLQDTTTDLNKTKEKFTRILAKAASDAGMVIDETTLTLLCRTNASIAVVAHEVKGDLDLDDKERNIGFAFVDVPQTGDTTNLPKGFYTLKVIGKPDSKIKELAFLNKKGHIIKRFPAKIEVINSEDSNNAGKCGFDGSIDKKQACVSAACCTDNGVLCISARACIKWG
jgi:hypothetical protein